jgi:hypothetical protein
MSRRYLLFPAMLVCCFAARSPLSAQEKAEHPLQELLTLVKAREAQIQETVQDYTCRIIKRELIGGRLQENRFIDAKVRSRVVQDGKIVKPFGVLLQFRSPKDLAGRRVLYVEGQNDGQLMVRRGGDRFADVVTPVALDADAVKQESQIAITAVGIVTMVEEIRKQITDDITADPDGTNTELKITRGVKINGRSCTRVEITHPRRAKGLEFYRGVVFADDEWHLPVRVEGYDWPKAEGEDPPLLGEFTYTDVKINVGLPDSDFVPEVLSQATLP